MKTFILHWRRGANEKAYGDDIAQAMNNLGYGQGALPALDYWEEIKDGNESDRKIKELLEATQEIISNLEDADAATNEETGEEFSDITRLKKAIAEMNGKEEL